MFHLRKWYLDGVTDEGTAFLGYVGELRFSCSGMRLLSVQHMSTLTSAPGQIAQERSAGAMLAWPQQERDVITWTTPQLRGTWRRQADAISTVLLDGAEGQIRWTSHMPSAEVKLQLADGMRWQGKGYVEELEMTAKPWKMPFDTLRWGRFIGPRRSVVWIDWRGGLEKRWVYLDGKPAIGGQVTDERLGWDGSSLELRRERVLRAGRVTDAAFPKMRWLGRLWPGGLGRASEQKWLSRGILPRPGQADETGWCVQEVVRWR